MNGKILNIYMVTLMLSLLGATLNIETALGGQYIYIAPSKYVYGYPLDETIDVVGYLRGINPGTPVAVTVWLDLPDGNSTYLAPSLEFHPGTRAVLEDFPFISVPVTKLFEIKADTVYTGKSGDYPGTKLTEFMPGKYVLNAKISGSGISDTSAVPFWIVGKDLLPSIAETPRPIVEEIDPPYGAPGDLVTIKGLKLRGDPGLVDPSLMDLMLVKVTVGGREEPVEYLAENGTLMRFRLLSNTYSGDLVVHLVVPYWIEDQDASGHLPVPQVVEFTSNGVPFFVAPEITGVSPQDFGPGDEVEISGINFSSAPGLNTVYFSGVPGTITEATNTTLKVEVPVIEPGASGEVTLQVVSNGVAGPIYFASYKSAKIYYVHPLRITPGDAITVYGQGFGQTTEGVSAYLGQYLLAIESGNDTVLHLMSPGSMVQGRYELRVSTMGKIIRFNKEIEVLPSW